MCSQWHAANAHAVVSSTSVAPPGFCNRGEVRCGSIGGPEYEVPQSRLYCPCINVALCSTALQCIRRVIRRSSMTMKAHTYYITFGRPPIGGKLPPFLRLAAPLVIIIIIISVGWMRRRRRGGGVTSSPAAAAHWSAGSQTPRPSSSPPLRT